MSSIRGLAIRGSFWTLIGYGASQVLRLVGNVVLARLLFPEAFGIMALVLVVMQGLNMLSDAGIERSIVQNRRGDEVVFLNTAWTIQIMRGFMLWIFACLLAWPMARLYGEPQLVQLLIVTGFGPIISGFTSTSLITLKRRVEIGPLARLEFLAQSVSLIVVICWALLHPTVWAIVAGGLVAAGLTLIVSHTAYRQHSCRIAWDRDSARELIRFGKWIFLATAVMFLASRCDRLILGKMLSLTELGIYSIALIFASISLRVAMRLMNTVLFPILCRQQDNIARLVAMCLDARRLVLWIGASGCAVIAILSPVFFGALYDPRYAEAGQIAQWLTLLIWTSLLEMGLGPVPLALGRSKVLFVGNVIRMSGVGLALLGYRFAGLPGFIVGMSVGPLLAHTYYVFELPDRRAEAFAQSIRFSVGLAVFVAAALLSLRYTANHASAVTLGVLTASWAIVPCAVVLMIVGRRVFGRRPQWDQSVAVQEQAVNRSR